MHCKKRGWIMKIAIYPGSFDPITTGHLDIIQRSAKLVDKLIVGVLDNSTKETLFSVDERVELIKTVTNEFSNVETEAFKGLLVDFAKRQNANLIIRGLRATMDFEYELQMAQTNHKLDPGIETVFLTTNVEYSYISSTLVKEIGRFNGPIEKFIPECIVEKVKKG
jgi:pantetheine-phosphate adenylyltransferase